MKVALVCAFASLVMLSSACARRAEAPALALSQSGWTFARERLDALRKEQVTSPYAVVLRVAMREPKSGKVFEARGALAVDPHRAMRMVLLGAAGRTAIDIWITRDRWSFSAPGIDFKRRGGKDPSATEGLPIGFFRWWFLTPLDGRLLSASLEGEMPTFLLRDGEGTITLKESGGDHSPHHVLALRREAGSVEVLEWMGRDFNPHQGDRARYIQDASGLQVEVLVEAVSPHEPDPAAFLDPDDPGTAL